jgi:hypothetical protein
MGHFNLRVISMAVDWHLHNCLSLALFEHLQILKSTYRNSYSTYRNSYITTAKEVEGHIWRH